MFIDISYMCIFHVETLEWTSLGPFDQAPSLRDYPAVVSINTKVGCYISCMIKGHSCSP